MIIKLLIQLIFGLVKALFSILPNLPQIPVTLMAKVTGVVDIIFQNLQLLPLFIRISTIKEITTLLVIILSFKHLYHIIMWIIKKIPLSVD